MQGEGRIHLRGQHPRQTLAIQRLDRPIVAHTGGVKYHGHGMLLGHRRDEHLQLFAVRDVAHGGPRLASQLAQLRRELLRALGLRAAPTDEQHMPSSMLAHQMASQQRPELPGRVGDQDRARGVGRGRQVVAIDLRSREPRRVQRALPQRKLGLAAHQRPVEQTRRSLTAIEVEHTEALGVLRRAERMRPTSAA